MKVQCWNRIQKVVKVIWHKTALLPQTNGSIVSARWRQCAFPCGHIGAAWRIRLNLCFLRPTRVHNPNGKSIGSADLAHSSQQKIPILTCTMGSSCPQIPKNASADGCTWTPSNTWFSMSTRVLNPNGIPIGSAVFAGLTSVTERPTDRSTYHANATQSSNNRPHLHCVSKSSHH